ncbi:MAG: hypothetical protein ACRD1V_12880 [Vicinamibacterales bacterium]
MPVHVRRRRVLPLAFCCAAAAAFVQSALPIPLVQGTQVGISYFQPGDTPQGGNGQPVDGIQGSSMEMLKVHIHAHLSLFNNGQQIAVPYGIGLVQPFQLLNGFVGRASGFYWLHTHDATGIIHIESPTDRVYTLGNFFDVWGEPLTLHNVAGLQGIVHAFLNGTPYTGNPRDIDLTAHELITLEVGRPTVQPPVYIFPTGL